MCLLVLRAIACNCDLSHFELALPGEDQKDVGCVQHREDEVKDEADKEELSHLRRVSFSKRHATAIKILLYHHDQLVILSCKDLLPLQMKKAFTEWVFQQVVVPEPNKYSHQKAFEQIGVNNIMSNRAKYMAFQGQCP